MKSVIHALIILLLFSACVENKENTKQPVTENESTKTAALSLEGNWEMVGFYNYRDNKVVDSFKTREGFRQVKMYNKNKVMWSKQVPSDSIEWFGYGSYKATDSTLTEQMEYGSNVMNTIIAEQGEFSYKLELSKNSFNQIQVDEDGYKIYAENYRRID